MRTTVGVLVAVALVVGGCTGGSEPGAEGTTATTTGAPTSTEPATPTPEPTPEVTMPVVEAPEPPESLTELSEEGAIASLQYFWDVYSYTNATKDFEPWEAITDPECLLCADLRQNIDDYQGYLHDTVISLADITINDFVPETGFIDISFTMAESGALLFDVDGRFIEERHFTEESAEFRAMLLHVDGRWLVAEVI